MIVTRIKSLLERRRRARRFSIEYSRDKNWKLPKNLKVNGKDNPLSLPDDCGTAIAFKDIFISDVYGLETLPHPPATVIDIGSHAGLFSLATRLYFPDATIHAYEPNPALWRHLDIHAKIGSFTFFQEAVGRMDGKAVLRHPGDSVFTQCVRSDGGETEVTAMAKAIDRIAGDKKLDLLKLDCEGAEWEILADEATMSRVRWLTLEYHLVGEHGLNEMFNLLKQAGFKRKFFHEDGPGNGRIRAERE